MDFNKIAEEWSSKARLAYFNHDLDAAIYALINSNSALHAYILQLQSEHHGAHQNDGHDVNDTSRSS